MNPSLRPLLLTLPLFAACLTSFAGELEVSSPWVRATVTGQPVTGAFMNLSSHSGVTLVGAASPVAETVEVHEMKQENGIMKMRALRQLAVPAGQSVQLAPGGYHIMLIDLKAPLKPGDKVPLTLKFKDKEGKRQQLQIKAEVRAMTSSGAAPASNASPQDTMHQHMHGASN